ncbi:hypothetical protein TNCV_4906381 [Trichonephila clavipes]|uniref:Uncharacterized protein n=1 Tax=Trichonephila clavipes TaxID=2585209 RepID=A0A8X6RS13_TRICX|nr:hypothetical protein TNCV_4906381 [Trichonephila clavipes]
MTENVSVSLDCLSVSSVELVSVDDDNAYKTPIVVDKDILEFVQSSKIIIHVDSDDENEMDKTAPAPTSSEMKNIIESTKSVVVMLLQIPPDRQRPDHGPRKSSWQRDQTLYSAFIIQISNSFSASGNFESKLNYERQRGYARVIVHQNVELCALDKGN